jgi:hypothetical protein
MLVKNINQFWMFNTDVETGDCTNEIIQISQIFNFNSDFEFTFFILPAGD